MTWATTRLQYNELMQAGLQAKGQYAEVTRSGEKADEVRAKRPKGRGIRGHGDDREENSEYSAMKALGDTGARNSLRREIFNEIGSPFPVVPTNWVFGTVSGKSVGTIVIRQVEIISIVESAEMSGKCPVSSPSGNRRQSERHKIELRYPTARCEIQHNAGTSKDASQHLVS